VDHNTEQIAYRPLEDTLASINIDPLKEDEKAQKKLSYKVSWALQTVLRRWEFPLANIIFSVWFWYHFHLFGDPAVVWNQLYSLMAIVVESIVGIGMFAQAKLDARLLRYVVRLMQLNEEQIAQVASLEGRIIDMEQRILAK